MSAIPTKQVQLLLPSCNGIVVVGGGSPIGCAKGIGIVNSKDNWDAIRKRIGSLGECSFRKSYHPELRLENMADAFFALDRHKTP